MRGSAFVQKLVNQALPSLGVGAASGAAALKLVEATKASPATVAGFMAAVGGLGSVLAKPGGMVSTGASSMAAVGAGLTVVDWMQKPATAQKPAQPQPAHPATPPHGAPIAHRQAELVTREELEDAVRELKELRNAFVMGAMPVQREPQYQRAEAPPQLRERQPQWNPQAHEWGGQGRPFVATGVVGEAEPFYEPMRNADHIVEEVMHGGARNAAAEAWHDVEAWRNADHVIDEVVHPHVDGSAARNADGHALMESWHHAGPEV